VDKAFKSLTILGWVQLGAYLLVLYSVMASLGIGTGVFLPTDQAGWSKVGDFGGILFQTYLAGGLTLVPSAIIFIRSGKNLKASTIGTAKTLQTILFAACCCAFLPLMFVQQTHIPVYGALLIATFLGIGFFPVQLALTKRAMAAASKLGLD
jgi:hypothetical protein